MLPRDQTELEIRPTFVVSGRPRAASCTGYCHVGSVQGQMSDTTRMNPNSGPLPLPSLPSYVPHNIVHLHSLNFPMDLLVLLFCRLRRWTSLLLVVEHNS